MVTNPSEGNDQDESEISALRRIEKLKQLKFRLLGPSKKSHSKSKGSAFKRSMIELTLIPHSSEKIAKEFDERI